MEGQWVVNYKDGSGWHQTTEEVMRRKLVGSYKDVDEIVHQMQKWPDSTCADTGFAQYRYMLVEVVEKWEADFKDGAGWQVTEKNLMLWRLESAHRDVDEFVALMRQSPRTYVVNTGYAQYRCAPTTVAIA